jgi:hypothetical protein
MAIYCKGEECEESTLDRSGFSEGLCDDCWEKVSARKANYWRGFRACLILIVAPIVGVLIVWAHIFINANS